MRIYLIAIVLALLGVSGCATSHHGWQKSNAVRTDVEKDKEQCEYEAKAATASYQTAPSKPGEAAAVGRAIGDGIVIAEKQIELTNACMRAKGYTSSR